MHSWKKPIVAPRPDDATELLKSIEIMPLPTAIVEPVTGRFVCVNRLFAKDWLPAEAQDLAALLDPQDRRHLAVGLEAELGAASAKKPPLLVRLPAPDDTLRWAQLHVSPFVADTLAGASLLMVQLVDVTAHRQLLDDATARETRWNSALVSSVSGVWDHNYADGVKYYSPTWRLIRGMEPDDPLPASREAWLALLHPDDLVATLHAMERQEAGDPDYQVFEYRERHKDGHWVWIECRGACIERAPDGRALRVVGTDTDITARKEAEHRMAQVSRRLEMALTISGVGVFEADFVTGEVDWDERMYAMYDLDPASRIRVGETWESFLHPDDRERVLANVQKNSEPNRCFWDQYRVLLPTGRTIVVRTCSMIFRDSDGHLKMVGANWDISQDVGLQQELERAKSLAEARNVELEAARVSIEHNAMHDHLTSLPNRRYLDDVLVQQALECRLQGGALGVLHIDLDRFKQINDTLGHSAGDAVLRHAARVLEDNVRHTDFVARIGGDEFVVLARFDGNPRRLAQLAERIIRDMRRPFSTEGRDCRFGASIGIAWAAGKDIDAGQILLNADIALYRAKNNGRNRHEFFSAETHQEIVSAKRLSDEILRGIERREFFPVYQLQFDAKTLEVRGVETLARWQHPEHGVLSPDRFIPVAEEIGAMATIDALILERGLEDFGRWTREGIAIPKLSVNVSYRRLRDPALVKKLQKLGIKPRTLSFELLESTFLDDCDEEITRSLKRIRALGIDLEIDDFGTGHASIVSLMRLSPRTLKIDRQLVQRLPESKDQVTLVRSIIEIGKSLGICVIAEGVETMQHARILRDIGCDTLQGYALARPLPYSDIAPLIAAAPWHKQA